jgi:hypothetical protein
VQTQQVENSAPDRSILIQYTTRPDYISHTIAMSESEYAHWMHINKVRIAWAVIETTKGE